MDLTNSNSVLQERTQLRFPYKGGIHISRPEQIIRLEAESNYTRIFFTDRKPVLMAKVLRAYQRLLTPYGFIRVHKSHLVNPVFVQEVTSQGHIVMTNDIHVEISRRHKREVFKTFTSSFHAA